MRLYGERVAVQRPGLSMTVARRGKAWCTGKGATPQAARGRITVVCTERKVHRGVAWHMQRRDSPGSAGPVGLGSMGPKTLAVHRRSYRGSSDCEGSHP